MSRFIDLPWPVFLDSGHCNGEFEYAEHGLDIIAARPSKRIISSDAKTTLAELGGCFQEIDEELFSAIRKRLPILPSETHPNPKVYPAAPGWIGNLSYDLSKQLESLPKTTKNDLSFPDAALGFYEWIIATNHKTKTTCLLYSNQADLTGIRERLSSPKKSIPDEAFRLTTNFTSDQSRESYRKRFDTIQKYILAGDAYQINFAQRFSAKCEGSSWFAYQTLRKNNPAPMGAFFSTDTFQLLSISPERFINVIDNKLSTSPIKGTRPQVIDQAKNQANINELQASEKDRAENLMIVDLLRNDFGKVCEPGSISVPSLFTIESYPNVHHLVSTITGTMASKYDAIEAIKKCFPGGSITGAPKIRAMDIIEEIEEHRRTAYCGSMVYFTVYGACDSNINIRTLIVKKGSIHCWGGGGIVADSVCEDEYQETFDKVGTYLKILEKM